MLISIWSESGEVKSGFDETGLFLSGVVRVSSGSEGGVSEFEWELNLILIISFLRGFASSTSCVSFSSMAMKVSLRFAGGKN